MAHRSSEGIGAGKAPRFPESRQARPGRLTNGGEMTIDTTFKEFVDERGIDFFLLDFGSRNYRKLVEAFNDVKSRLAAEEEAREHEKARAWLSLREQSVMEKLRRVSRLKGRTHPFSFRG